MLLLASQVVQKIDDISLVRVFYRHVHDDDDDDVPKTNNIENEKNNNDNDDNNNIIPELALSSRLVVSSWVKKAAQLLQEQWPRQQENEGNNTDEDEEDSTDYYQKFIVHHDNQSYPRYSLACSYILIEEGRRGSSQSYDGGDGDGDGDDDDDDDDDDTTKPAIVLGHGRLTECYETAGGNAAAATYILIDPIYRGKGYGKLIMCLLEREVTSKERLGCQYHFIYLWCKINTVPFYERSGYLLSQNRVSLQRPCLKKLTATSVQTLEGILQRRCRRIGTTTTTTTTDNNTVDETKNASNNIKNKQTEVLSDGNNTTTNNNNVSMMTGYNHHHGKKKIETVMLLSSRPKDDNNRKNNKTHDTNNSSLQDEPVDDDVWLRKRLIDFCESSINISKQDRIDQMEKFIVNHRQNVPFTTTSTTTAATTTTTTGKTIDIHNNNDKDWKWSYRWNSHVPWQQQIGPSCGLTAIRMVRDFYYMSQQSRQQQQKDDVDEEQQEEQQEQYRADYGVGNNNVKQRSNLHNPEYNNNKNDVIYTNRHKESESPSSSLLVDAQERGYTQDGEMFDVEHLRELLEDQLVAVGGVDFAVRTREVCSLAIEEIDSTLRHGGLWILPYDSNPRTKLPSKLQGKHAHWGILVGILYAERMKAEPPTNITTTADARAEEGEEGKMTVMGESLQKKTDYSCNWCVQHSLSSQWSIASMEDWVESNRQLISINDQKFIFLNNEKDLNLKNKIIQVLQRYQSNIYI
jgi:GNAT superfamily N-acetyltransferase